MYAIISRCCAIVKGIFLLRVSLSKNKILEYIDDSSFHALTDRAVFFDVKMNPGPINLIEEATPQPFSPA